MQYIQDTEKHIRKLWKYRTDKRIKFVMVTYFILKHVHLPVGSYFPDEPKGPLLPVVSKAGGILNHCKSLDWLFGKYKNYELILNFSDV